MSTTRPKILLVCNQWVRENYLAPVDIERLASFAQWEWFACEGGGIYDTNVRGRFLKLFGSAAMGAIPCNKRAFLPIVYARKRVAVV